MIIGAGWFLWGVFWTAVEAVVVTAGLIYLGGGQ